MPVRIEEVKVAEDGIFVLGGVTCTMGVTGPIPRMLREGGVATIGYESMLPVRRAWPGDVGAAAGEAAVCWDTARRRCFASALASVDVVVDDGVAGAGDEQFLLSGETRSRRKEGRRDPPLVPVLEDMALESVVNVTISHGGGVVGSPESVSSAEEREV